MIAVARSGGPATIGRVDGGRSRAAGVAPYRITEISERARTFRFSDGDFATPKALRRRTNRFDL
ncbi:MAG: hypothetical protein GX458_09790 [Phyllobacteriaceae bacterium]|nr:hypothetical protein [Phyllobacteriaceae bacterium]